MTQEEKNLLTKDLCARLPYYMWAEYEGKEWLVTGYGHGRVSLLPSLFSSVGGPCPLVEEVRPYLRPMSSMTEEEEREFNRILPCGMSFSFTTHGELIIYTDSEYDGDHYFSCFVEIQDYLNAHHFDYRGLIGKGLALVAPEGMYTKESNK